MLRNRSKLVQQLARVSRRTQSSVAVPATEQASANTIGEVMKLGLLLESGLAGGVFGSLVGLGAHGGTVAAPALKTVAKYTATQAAGTVSMAVAAIGVSGTLAYTFADGGYFGCANAARDFTFGLVEGQIDLANGVVGNVDVAGFFRGSGVVGKVDYFAAGVVGLGALIGARFGGKITSRFNPVFLQRTFGLFQMIMAPLVPLKGMADRQKADEKALVKKKSVAEWGGTYTQTEKYFKRVAELLTCGFAAGSAFTMLGVGGGIVIAPMLCLMTEMDHAMVLGTTLTAMLPASLLQAGYHMRAGNVVMSGALPLSFAAAAGAFFGGKLAVDANEENLQIGFGVLVFALGCRRLLNPGL
jgi:uncharacterized membrane protein YfcA